jgi:hypothetical protein
LWALNEEMGYDSRIKEKIDVQKMKRIIPEEKLKNFIELPNADLDLVVEKETFNLLNNQPPQEEKNITIIDDDVPVDLINDVIKVKVDVTSAIESDV